MDPSGVGDSEPPSKRQRRNASGNERQRHEFGVMRRSSEHETSVFVGSGSGIHFVQSVYNAAASNPRASGKSAQEPENDAVPGEDDQLANEATNSGSKSLWTRGEVANRTEGREPTTFDGLLTWSQSYWDRWHAAFPFLHAPTILEWFNEIAQKKFDQIEPQLDPVKLAIVKSIFSISLADQRQTSGSLSMRGIPSVLVFESFDAAVGSAHAALVCPPSILALQHALAVQLFLMSMLRHNAASRIGGLIVRMIFHMGLHRCPVRYPTFSEDETLLRKRILWSVYCIDRHLSQSLGLPLGIRDDDIDVCFLDKEVHSTERAPTGLDERLALLNFLSKIFKLKGMILELCNKSIEYRQAGTDTATDITSKITKLNNDIEDFLDTATPDSQSLNEQQLTTLRVLQQECTISLNRPLLTTSKTSAEYRAGLQVCISASRSIISTLSKQLQQGAVLLWPSFTWAVWMSAFIVLYAAIEKEMPDIVATRLAEQSIKILEHLSSRASVWPDACAAAIRTLCSRLEQFGNPFGRVRTRQSEARQSISHTAKSNGSMHGSASGLTPKTILQNSPSRASRAQPTPSIQQTYTQSAISNANSSDPQNAQEVQTSGSANTMYDDSVYRSSEASGSSGPDPATNQLFGFNNGDALASFLPWSSTDVSKDGDVDLFEGFDIPFWLGQDEFSAAWMPS